LSVWAVVVAAGQGNRFGARKQFAMLRGQPLVNWSVATAREATDGVVVVLPPEDPRLSGDPVSQVPRADAAVAGGSTRSESVRAGLGAVPDDAEVIVVHDGARPLASKALFHEVIEAVRAGADGAVPAVELVDTLKRVRDTTVVETVPRGELRIVQTPQAFGAHVLRQAHERGGEATDDAALVEAMGATVRIVPGDPRNLKVTTPTDLELAQALAEP
jgi:2-C-methyl-D-erythritol 4-phosphate cytidylyltransferase